MRSDLLRAVYLQADETTVSVQLKDKSGANHQAYLWQYGSLEARYSSCNWVADVKVRTSFLASGKVFCKPTAIKLLYSLGRAFKT